MEMHFLKLISNVLHPPLPSSSTFYIQGQLSHDEKWEEAEFVRALEGLEEEGVIEKSEDFVYTLIDGKSPVMSEVPFRPLDTALMTEIDEDDKIIPGGDVPPGSIKYTRIQNTYFAKTSPHAIILPNPKVDEEGMPVTASGNIVASFKIAKMGLMMKNRLGYSIAVFLEQMKEHPSDDVGSMSAFHAFPNYREFEDTGVIRAIDTRVVLRPMIVGTNAKYYKPLVSFLEKQIRGMEEGDTKQAFMKGMYINQISYCH